MTTGAVQKGPLMWLGLTVLVLLFGLCTVFALVVTVAQAWQENLQARWPEAAARVDQCGLVRTSSGRRGKFYIRCRVNYALGAEQHAANIYFDQCSRARSLAIPAQPDRAVQGVGE